MKTYKELKYLWSWLDFVLWCGDWRKIEETCQKIDIIAKQHPIINFFAMVLVNIREMIIKILVVYFVLYLILAAFYDNWKWW